MACCNSRRGDYGSAVSGLGAAAARQHPLALEFEYVGGTAMTVTGPVSGKQYRFGNPGARLAIDPRDRLGLSRVPKLRQVR